MHYNDEKLFNDQSRTVGNCALNANCWKHKHETWKCCGLTASTSVFFLVTKRLLALEPAIFLQTNYSNPFVANSSFAYVIYNVYSSSQGAWGKRLIPCFILSENAHYHRNRLGRRRYSSFIRASTAKSTWPLKLCRQIQCIQKYNSEWELCGLGYLIQC